MDLVVSDQIVAAHDGSIQYGVFNVGLKEGYVGLSDMKHTKHLIPAEALQAVETVKHKVMDGTVIVPSTYQELAAFQPPSAAQ